MIPYFFHPFSGSSTRTLTIVPFLIRCTASSMMKNGAANHSWGFTGVPVWSGIVMSSGAEEAVRELFQLGAVDPHELIGGDDVELRAQEVDLRLELIA